MCVCGWRGIWSGFMWVCVVDRVCLYDGERNGGVCVEGLNFEWEGKSVWLGGFFCIWEGKERERMAWEVDETVWMKELCEE